MGEGFRILICIRMRESVVPTFPPLKQRANFNRPYRDENDDPKIYRIELGVLPKGTSDNSPTFLRQSLNALGY